MFQVQNTGLDAVHSLLPFSTLLTAVYHIFWIMITVIPQRPFVNGMARCAICRLVFVRSSLILWNGNARRCVSTHDADESKLMAGNKVYSQIIKAMSSEEISKQTSVDTQAHDMLHSHPNSTNPSSGMYMSFQ